MPVACITGIFGRRDKKIVLGLRHLLCMKLILVLSLAQKMVPQITISNYPMEREGKENVVDLGESSFNMHCGPHQGFLAN